MDNPTVSDSPMNLTKMMEMMQKLAKDLEEQKENANQLKDELAARNSKPADEPKDGKKLEEMSDASISELRKSKKIEASMLTPDWSQEMRKHYEKNKNDKYMHNSHCQWRKFESYIMRELQAHDMVLVATTGQRSKICNI